MSNTRKPPIRFSNTLLMAHTESIFGSYRAAGPAGRILLGMSIKQLDATQRQLDQDRIDQKQGKK